MQRVIDHLEASLIRWSQIDVYIVIYLILSNYS